MNLNNCWWGWKNRTVLGKCTGHYDENKETIIYERFPTKKILLRVQEYRQTTKEEGSKEEDKEGTEKEGSKEEDKEGGDVRNFKIHFLHQLLLVFTSLLYFLLLLLSVCFLLLLSILHPRKTILSKALMYDCFIPVFCRIGEYISLDQF